jgi:cytochrome c oxidase subunit 3
MWLFLATEVLFFGALLLAWIYSRHWNATGFDAGAARTALWAGTLNTAILITRSFTPTPSESCMFAAAISGG